MMKPSRVHAIGWLLVGICFFAANADVAGLCFLVTTFIVIGYAGYEIYSCMRNGAGGTGLVAPPILASGLIFGVFYGITNLAFFTASGEEKLGRLGIDYAWLARAESLALLGLLAMWVGYRSIVGVWLALGLERLLRLRRLLCKSWDLRWSGFCVCVLISVGCRLIQISLGMYGYGADRDDVYEGAAYNQYLGLGGQLGKLALTALALHCVSSNNRSRATWGALYVVLGVEVLFGVLAGMKSQFVIPFVIIAGCYYVVRERFPTMWVGAALLSLPLAFYIVEPFREVLQGPGAGDKPSISQLSGSLAQAATRTDTGSHWESSLFGPEAFSILGRFNVTGETARAIQFDDLEGLGPDAPPFLANLVFSPLYAFIPRFLFPDKPFSNVGNWFATEVVGGTTSTNSIAIGPVGYLYFAGGILGVGIGFFAIGIVQRMIFTAFWGRGSGALLVYLGMLGTLVFFENTVDPIFISVLRLLPVLLICQYFLFQRASTEPGIPTKKRHPILTQETVKQ